MPSTDEDRPQPALAARTMGDPIDIFGYLWSIRRFLPIGLLVAVLVFGGAFLYAARADEGATTVSGNVITTLRVQTPAAPGAAADAAAAAATYASLAMSPPMLEGYQPPAGLTTETIRPRVTVYSSGTAINFLVTGLNTPDAEALGRGVAQNMLERSQRLAPMTVGGEPAVLVKVTDPYVSAITTSTRSKIQRYVVSALLAGTVGFATAAILGVWSRRRQR